MNVMTTNTIHLPDMCYSEHAARESISEDLSPSDSGVIIVNGKYMAGFSKNFAASLARRIRSQKPFFVALLAGNEEWYTSISRELNTLGIECDTPQLDNMKNSVLH